MRSGLTPGDGRRRIGLMAATGVLSCLTLLGAGLGWSLLHQAVIPESKASEPVRLRIPAIGVDAPVQPLIVDQNGVLPPPDTSEGTGWWRDGPEPGERGPAVIAGHLDSYRAPAVFFRLTDLTNGDSIFLDRVDGTTAVFTTQHIERHEKNAFPTDAVYGATPDAQLRLITCGGEFDYQDRRYLDNIIVYAIRTG